MQVTLLTALEHLDLSGIVNFTLEDLGPLTGLTYLDIGNNISMSIPKGN